MILHTRTQWILLLATAAIASVGGFYGARLTTGDAATRPTTAPAEESISIPVATADLRDGDLSDTAVAYGVVQNRLGEATAVAVAFDAVPTIVHVAVGQSVPAGATLVELQPSPEASLQLRQAEQTLAAAVKTAEQARSRRDEQLATNADVVTAEQAQAAAQLQLDAVKSRGVGTARTLRAEKAGVVTAVAAQPGQLAPAGSPMVVVAPDDSIQVRLGVDSADAARIKVGDAITLSVPNSTNTLAGTVEQQSRALNAQRLCDVFVRPNSATGLRPGAFVQGRFTRGVVHGLIVSRSATQLEDDEWCIYTVKDDKAVRHVVTLGPSDGRDIVVTGDGLSEGDAVVVERNGELSDGAAVKAEPPEEDAK